MEKGKGFPLILLHGNGEDSTYFCHQMEEFSKKYHVYALDTRGHGRTSRGSKPFRISQFAEDLHEFMEIHDIAKAHILGFSDGANIAMVFAIQYPEKVDKLILNGGNLNPEGVKRSVQFPIEVGYQWAKILAKKSSKAGKRAEMLGLMVNDPNLKSEDLINIQSRTLVIAGTRDMIRKEHTILISDSIADSSLVFIEGTHFIANQKPIEFNEAVLRFLGEDEEDPYIEA
ncbi:MAG: alpha/beta hydrolase [Clostridiales bacterium]|nr:alpha/beta hydrolase [Clostridiales bacterium]